MYSSQVSGFCYWRGARLWNNTPLPPLAAVVFIIHNLTLCREEITWTFSTGSMIVESSTIVETS